jgi:hypothetical protein
VEQTRQEGCSGSGGVGRRGAASAVWRGGGEGTFYRVGWRAEMLGGGRAAVEFNSTSYVVEARRGVDGTTD